MTHWNAYPTLDGKDPVQVMEKDFAVVAAVLEDIFQRRHEESEPALRQEALRRLPDGWNIHIMGNAVSAHYNDHRALPDRRFAVPVVTRWEHKETVEKDGFIRFKADECGWCGMPLEGDSWECPHCGGS